MDLCLSWPHWFVRHLKSIFHFYNFKNWKKLINCCANMIFVVSTIILSFKILSSLTSCVDPKFSSLRCPVGIARPLPRALDSIWSSASLHNQTLAFGDWVTDEIKPNKAAQHISNIRYKQYFIEEKTKWWLLVTIPKSEKGVRVLKVAESRFLL